MLHSCRYLMLISMHILDANILMHTLDGVFMHPIPNPIPILIPIQTPVPIPISMHVYTYEQVRNLFVCEKLKSGAHQLIGLSLS